MTKLQLASLLLLLSTPLGWANLEALKARIPKIVALKEKGIVGEQRDGLLGIVKKDPEAEKIVAEENRDRLKVYSDRANEQGIDVETLRKVLGDAKVREEKAGRYIQDDKGAWIKK